MNASLDTCSLARSHSTQISTIGSLADAMLWQLCFTFTRPCNQTLSYGQPSLFHVMQYELHTQPVCYAAAVRGLPVHLMLQHDALKVVSTGMQSITKYQKKTFQGAFHGDAHNTKNTPGCLKVASTGVVQDSKTQRIRKETHEEKRQASLFLLYSCLSNPNCFPFQSSVWC